MMCTWTGDPPCDYTSCGGRDSIPGMLVSPIIALVKKKIKKVYLKIFVFNGVRVEGRQGEQGSIEQT